MYDEILLPTDGSDGVARAVDEAISLAATFDAILHVLYVVDTSAVSGVPGADAANIQELLENVGQEAIRQIDAGASDRGVEVVGRTRYGQAHRAILEYADEADPDLIVMGTHGRSGIDRLLIGSVTERVIKRASQPVLVIRAEA